MTRPSMFSEEPGEAPVASEAAAATCPRHERELMLRGEQGSTARGEREINCGRSIRGVLVYGESAGADKGEGRGYGEVRTWVL